MLDPWIERALDRQSQRQDRAVQLRRRDARDRPRARRRTCRRVDLVGERVRTGGSTRARRATATANSRSAAQIGLAFNCPDLPGRVRQLARPRGDRAAGHGARRTSRSRVAPRVANAQIGFSGVNSAAASVTAFEQARALGGDRARVEPARPRGRRAHQPRRAERAAELFFTQRDLAQSYFNYLISLLRLKASVGALTEQDLEDINRRLAS